MEFWRKQWANLCNAKFEEKSFPVRIDHRSYERQGQDILPTIHEGPTVWAMEKKGIRTEKGKFNRWIKATSNAIREIKNTILALVDWLKEAKEELSKPKAPSLIVLFQAYYTQRNTNAYSQKAKTNNLKEMTALYNYMKANGIHDLETLESRLDALHATLDELKVSMDSMSKQMKELQKLPQYLGTYKERKSVADGLKKIKFDKAKEKYKAEHADDLKRFYEARRKITAKFPDGKYDSRILDEEIAKLEQEYSAAYEQFKRLFILIPRLFGKLNPMLILPVRT